VAIEYQPFGLKNLARLPHAALDCSSETPRHQALLAAWREGLLGAKVLQGGTRGYRNHPQLIRFRAHKDPVEPLPLISVSYIGIPRARLQL